jgi:hypothetical protein
MRPPLSAAGATPVQVRLAIALTSDEYIRRQAWRDASLPGCPFGNAPCRAVGHGSYARMKPAGLRIARCWCAPCGVSIGLLPDFAASRVSGTLDDYEEVAAAAERARSQWAAADELRPDGELQSAVRFVGLRVRTVRELLGAAVGMVRELLGCEPTLSAVRDRLGLAGGVLRRLRELCRPHLEALAAPLGLVPRPHRMGHRRRGHPQSTGPDPPTATE